MFKRKGEGGKGLLNNVKKNCTFLNGWLPLLGYRWEEAVNKDSGVCGKNCVSQTGFEFSVLDAWRPLSPHQTILLMLHIISIIA